MNSTIIKSGVTTASTISLTDLPIKSGEILELACKLFANGATDESHVIKVLEGSTKYNTETPLSAYYALVFRDGGFYVGPRSSADDLEPKEGDFFSFANRYYEGGYGSVRSFYTTSIYMAKTCKEIFFDLTKNKIVNKDVKDCNPLVTNSWQSSAGATNWDTSGNKTTGLLIPVTTLSRKEEMKIGFRVQSNISLKATGYDVEDALNILLGKYATSSDILAYTNTGALGKLFLSDSAIESGTTVDSLTLCATAPISVDGTTAETTQVGSLYITTSAVSGEVTSEGEIYKVYKSNL